MYDDINIVGTPNEPTKENDCSKKKFGFNYAFGPHFGVKISKWYPNV